MSRQHYALLAVLGIGLVAAVYYAMQNDGSAGRPVPAVQGETQVMGMGVGANLMVNPGTALDLRPEVHFWVPGYDPDPTATPCVKTRHRYPAIPGGNTSTVMHKGWSAMCKDAPADNDWRLNPPELAVL
jgi:hypothetical protein